MARSRNLLRLTVSKRQMHAWSALAILTVLVHLLGADTVEYGTLYPSPSGVYKRLTTTGDATLARESGSVIIGAGSFPGAGKLAVAGNARFSGVLSAQGANFSGIVDMGDKNIRGAAEPVDPTDLATKKYVDDAVSKLSPGQAPAPAKPPCEWSSGAWGPCVNCVQTREVKVLNGPEGTNCEGGTKPPTQQSCGPDWYKCYCAQNPPQSSCGNLSMYECVNNLVNSGQTLQKQSGGCGASVMCDRCAGTVTLDNKDCSWSETGSHCWCVDQNGNKVPGTDGSMVCTKP